MKLNYPYLALLAILLFLVWAFANRAEAALPAWFMNSPISTIYHPDKTTFTPDYIYYCWLSPTVYGWAAFKVSTKVPFDPYTDTWVPSDGKFCKAAAALKWPNG